MTDFASVLLTLIDHQPLTADEHDLLTSLAAEPRSTEQRYLLALLIMRLARRCAYAAAGAPEV